MKGVPFLERITIAEFFATHFARVRKEQLNAEALSEMATGDRIGVVFGGRKAATVSLPNPATRAAVKDREAFLAWAKEHMPWAVETVEQVRPATQASLLRDAKANGGKWLDKESGEYVEIDGIEITAADPSPRVELAPDAAEVIGEAWRAGLIDLGGMLAYPAIEAGGEQDAA